MQYNQTHMGTLEVVSDPSQFSTHSPHYHHSRGRGQYNHRGGGGWRGGHGGQGGFQSGYQNSNRFVDFNKPWISQAIRTELWKKKSLADAAKRSKTAETVAMLQTQSELCEKLLSEAKIAWLAANPEMEAQWLPVLAAEEGSRTYFCDVCDKMVGNAAEYKQHVSEHATCGIDGCEYTAHQDILEAHIRHQHLSGFYNRIVQGNTPEDIEKWRAERRKNWPTHIKIAEKIVAQEALRERGEVMHLKREKRRREELSDRTNNQQEEPEREWECNCKARHFVEGLRGRGRGRGRGRNWIPRNIRHQGHCRELELIRERAKEKREKKEAAFEEKREKRKLEAEERRKREGESGERKEKEEKPKVKKMKVEHDDCSSDEEGWNGGMWMFRGTVHMEEERLKQEKVAQIKIEEAHIKQEQNIKLSSSLVSYDNEDSDEAPEEIKTVVSYENDVPEDTTSDHDGETKSSKKLRKRRKKHYSGDERVNKPEEVQNAAEIALKEVRATIESHIQSFDNPPVPGEDNVVKDTESDIHDAIPEPPAEVEEFVEEPQSSLSIEKPKQEVPVVFKRRLRHPTLLEKLLLSEIKSERNTILQCVRYVCKNNFFQSDKK